MDRDEFKNKVAELADIEDIKVPKPNIRSKKQEEYGDVFPPGENPTLGFELKGIREQTKLCELGCGEMVVGQRVEYKRYDYPVTHWRTKCVNCDCTLSPDKTGFIQGATQVNNTFYRYFKDK